MTKEEFMEQMDLVLDGAKVTWDSKLEEIEEWDSIAIISLLSLASAHGNKVTLPAIKEAKTVREIYELVNTL